MLNQIAEQLQHPDPQTRIEALYVLAMVQETEAIDLLEIMWQTESSPEVKQVLQSTASILLNAKQQGYSTMQGMRTVYKLDLIDEQTKQNWEKQVRLETELRNARLHGNVPASLQVDLSRTIALAALTAPTGAMLISLTFKWQPAYNAELQGLKLVERALWKDEKRPNATRPILPPRPADTNISIWLRKLSSTDAQIRLSAAHQLADFNNPAALGPLATRFATDSDPKVCEISHRTGNQIYLSALYWQNPLLTA